VNEKQVQSIEGAFDVQLPPGYRHLLLQPPRLLQAWVGAEEKDNPGQSPIFFDAKMIVGINQMMRDPDDPDYFGFDPNDPDVPWPKRYLIIGSDVGGNFYCIAPGSGRSRVYFWYQGNTAFSKFADDMPHFVKRLFRAYGEVAAMDCEPDTEE
jgi:hypothetical protein